VSGIRGLIVAGYGGHAAYSFAVAYELAKLGFKLDILLPRGYEYLAGKFKGLGSIYYMELPRKPLEPIYYGLHRWVKAFIESTSFIKRDYGFVFASGSNFSIPVSTMLKVLRGVPLYVLEDVNRFSKPAKAVKFLERVGAKVLLQWDEQRELCKNGVVVGVVYEPPLYKPREEGYVLVTLGTLGSRDVFDAIIKLNYEKAVVQTGDIDPEVYKDEKPNWVFFKYTEDLHKWLAGASVVITHPGTTAATARLAYGKPVVIVYTKRHSTLYPLNDVARLAEKLNAVFVCEITPKTLVDAVEMAIKLEKPTLGNGAFKASRLIYKECLKTQAR
jgi:UDP-N-acetylglucosamine:LPS N-acetylglucosamine transferase